MKTYRLTRGSRREETLTFAERGLQSASPLKVARRWERPAPAAGRVLKRRERRAPFITGRAASFPDDLSPVTAAATRTSGIGCFWCRVLVFAHYALCTTLHAFSLIEILVVIGLLSVIILGLLAMFNQTQRAFRTGMTQVDVLASGRAASDMIARELSQITPANYTRDAVTFSAGLYGYTPFFFPPPFQPVAPSVPDPRRVGAHYIGIRRIRGSARPHSRHCFTATTPGPMRAQTSAAASLTEWFISRCGPTTRTAC